MSHFDHAAAPSGHFPAGTVHRRRRAVAERGVNATLAVEREVPSQALLQRPRRRVVVQVDPLVLHRSPQPLDEHVVHPAAAAAHAHRHARRLDPPSLRSHRLPP